METEKVTSRLRVGLVVPTLNASRYWQALREGIRMQTLQPDEVLVVDSSSDDGTESMAESAGFRVIRIERSEFSHGKTRQMAANLLPTADILIYLTQDAIPAHRDSFRLIVAAFRDAQIGAAYGRQLPRPGAGPIEAHARMYNYPPVAAVRTFESRKTLGLKAAFASNSFAAYRRNALFEVGGFPPDALVSEDSLAFARLQMAGWKTAYVAESAVYHSHNFSLMQEFSRYFDIAVGHARQSWFEKEYSAPYGEGKRFFLSEVRSLMPGHAHLVPVVCLRSFVKVMAYRLGRAERHLPDLVKRQLSAQKHFWAVPHPKAQSLHHARSDQDVYVNE